GRHEPGAREGFAPPYPTATPGQSAQRAADERALSAARRRRSRASIESMRRDRFSEAAQCGGRTREHRGAREAFVALAPALPLAYLIVAGGCSSSGAQRAAATATQQHSASAAASAPPAPAPKPPPHLLVN